MVALENISYGVNADRVGEDFQECSWDASSKTDAVSLLNTLTSFDFIISFLIVYDYLSHLAGITLKLQGTAMDVMKAHHEVSVNGTLGVVK